METYIPLIVAFLMVAPLWWDKIINLKKNKSEGSSAQVNALQSYEVLTDGLVVKVTQLQKDMGKVIDQNVNLQYEIKELKEWISRLLLQLIEHGVTPVKLGKLDKEKTE